MKERNSFQPDIDGIHNFSKGNYNPFLFARFGIDDNAQLNRGPMTDNGPLLSGHFLQLER
jgi:hypothetical protein